MPYTPSFQLLDATMSNWVSITAADFAEDGWFNGPRLADIHPALRETTNSGSQRQRDSTKSYESDHFPDYNAIDPILELSEMDFDGGADKIALPVDVEGSGLIPLYEEGSDGYHRTGRNFQVKRYPDRPATKPRYVLYQPAEEKPNEPYRLLQRAPSSASSQASSPRSGTEPFPQFNQNRFQHLLQPRFEPGLEPLWSMQPDHALAINQAHWTSSPLQQSAPFPSPQSVHTQPQYPASHLTRSGSRTTSVDNSSLPSLSHWSSESDREPSPPKMKSPRKSKTLPMNTLKRFLKSSSPPLVEAAKIGDYNEVLRLLAPGAQNHPVSAVDKDGLTALHHACRLGYRDIAYALILRHTDLEIRTKVQDRTALFYAVHAGYSDIVIDLLQNHADVDSVSKMDGATALHKASQQGHEDIMRLLIGAGADVNRRDVEGMPPLMWATQGKKLNAARLLITSGANLETRIKLGANLELSSKEGLTVLQKAVNNGDNRFARLFLEMGADPNALGPHGLRPLHKAASKGSFELCAMLIEAGGEVGTRSDDGWTALHFAARYGHKQVAQLLIQKGCEPMVQSLRGETAKELAERYGHFGLI